MKGPQKGYFIGLKGYPNWPTVFFLFSFCLAYMKELRQSVNMTARLLCKLASNNPTLLNLFPQSQLQFILQTGTMK